MSRSDGTTGRVHGLDALRAVCALVVVMGHVGGPPFTGGLDRGTSIGYLIGGAYNNVWNGPAAVIAFFVISGFCIHYPFAGTLAIPQLSSYGVRRLLRIGVPLALAAAVSPALGVRLTLFHASIMWSLLAELVYYTLYPGLLALRRQGLAWRTMWTMAFAIGLMLAATKPFAGDYPAFGPALNWLLGLPCWLAGCELAERAATGRLPRPASIWAWRLAVWAAAAAASVLRFHSPVGYPWTLNIFAVLVWYWIGGEVSRVQDRQPGRVLVALEWMGAWSYSLYLVHLPARAAWQMAALPSAGSMLDWLLLVTFTLGVSYAFYRAVEHPSHLLARRLARLLARSSTDTPLTVGREAAEALGRSPTA